MNKLTIIKRKYKNRTIKDKVGYIYLFFFIPTKKNGGHLGFLEDENGSNHLKYIKQHQK